MKEKSRDQRKAMRALKIALIVAGSTLGLLVVSSLALLLLFTWYLGFLTPHPTDEKLVLPLEEHLDEYELLITMFREDDPLRVVAPTWIDPDEAITQARWEEYNKIFARLDLDMGMRAWGNKGTREWNGETAWFISSNKGLAIGGTMKGLMYKPKEPIPQFDSLNERPVTLEENVMAYRKINDDWYIVRQDGP